MKGLLLKDFYMVKKYCKTYLLFALVFNAVSLAGNENLFFAFYPCLLSGMIPVTLLGYDERSKWNEYCSTLPYTKAQIVSGKYLMGLFVQIFVLILSGITQAVRMNISGGFVWNNYLMLMSILLFISCIAASINLPFMFKYGVEKGRIAYYLMIGFVCASSAAASGIYNVKLQTEVSFNGTLAILCIIGVVLYALSWWSSIEIYKKQEI